MYFYISKTYKNEQTKLLEMYCNACIRFRNGSYNDSLIKNTQLK